jgi:hypothetical protein
MFDHPLEMIMDILACWLHVPNEGDEVYPLRDWPVIAHEDVDAYHEWFDREWVANKPPYATPSHCSSLSPLRHYQ